MHVLVGLFLVAHGLIHASYLAPAPAPATDGPEWPFEMGRSWLATGIGLDGAVRVLGTVLVIGVVVGFALSGLAWLGILVPAAWWPMLTVASSVLSAILLVLFFHPWISLGLVIDAALIWLVFANVLRLEGVGS